MADKIVQLWDRENEENVNVLYKENADGETYSQSVANAGGAAGVEIGDVNISENYAPVGAHSSGVAILTAVTLTKPVGASQIIIQALGQNVRFTLDGTTPTPSIGFQLSVGAAPIILAVPGVSIQVIQELATATLQYQWIS